MRPAQLDCIDFSIFTCCMPHGSIIIKYCGYPANERKSTNESHTVRTERTHSNFLSPSESPANDCFADGTDLYRIQIRQSPLASSFIYCLSFNRAAVQSPSFSIRSHTHGNNKYACACVPLLLRLWQLN